MINFKKFYEEMTGTGAVAGAGTNPEKIVPVHVKKKREGDIKILKRFIQQREDSQKKWSK